VCWKEQILFINDNTLNGFKFLYSINKTPKYIAPTSISALKFFRKVDLQILPDVKKYFIEQEEQKGLEGIKYLHKKVGMRFNENDLISAIRCGYREKVIYFVEKLEISVDEDILYMNISNSRIKRYLKKHLKKFL
jgi:hypothetical protein